MGVHRRSCRTDRKRHWASVMHETHVVKLRSSWRNGMRRTSTYRIQSSILDCTRLLLAFQMTDFIRLLVVFHSALFAVISACLAISPSHSMTSIKLQQAQFREQCWQKDIHSHPHSHTLARTSKDGSWHLSEATKWSFTAATKLMRFELSWCSINRQFLSGKKGSKLTRFSMRPSPAINAHVIAFQLKMTTSVNNKEGRPATISEMSENS